MPRLLLILLLVLSPVSCRRQRGPIDPHKVHTISSIRSIIHCYKKADVICPYGYELVAQDKRITGASSFGNSVIVHERSTIMIRCYPEPF